MTRPARAPSAVWREIATRWADNDAYGHVNNVDPLRLVRHGGERLADRERCSTSARAGSAWSSRPAAPTPPRRLSRRLRSASASSGSAARASATARRLRRGRRGGGGRGPFRPRLCRPRQPAAGRHSRIRGPRSRRWPRGAFALPRTAIGFAHCDSADPLRFQPRPCQPVQAPSARRLPQGSAASTDASDCGEGHPAFPARRWRLPRTSGPPIADLTRELHFVRDDDHGHALFRQPGA